MKKLLLLFLIWGGYGYADPKLTVTKDVDPKTVTRGETITYTVSYENIGTGTARDVAIEDEIPPPTKYIIGSAGASGYSATITYSHDGGLNYDENQTEPITHIRWEIIGDVPQNGKGEVYFSVRIR